MSAPHDLEQCRRGGRGFVLGFTPVLMAALQQVPHPAASGSVRNDKVFFEFGMTGFFEFEFELAAKS